VLHTDFCNLHVHTKTVMRAAFEKAGDVKYLCVRRYNIGYHVHVPRHRSCRDFVLRPDLLSRFASWKSRRVLQGGFPMWGAHTGGTLNHGGERIFNGDRDEKTCPNDAHTHACTHTCTITHTCTMQEGDSVCHQPQSLDHTTVFPSYLLSACLSVCCACFPSSRSSELEYGRGYW
jgi:hypothetical protein